VTAARRAPQEAALGAEGANVIDSNQRKALVIGLRDIVSTRSKSDPRGSEMTGLVKEFAKAVKRKDFDVNELEAFRKRLGSIAWAWGSGPMSPKVAERGRVEARRFYQVVRNAIEYSSPKYARTLSAGERLRRMEQSLSDVKVSDVDDVLLKSFWAPGTKKTGATMKRWDALQEYGSPDDIAAMKGWYFWNLVKAGTAADGTLHTGKLSKALDSTGIFNKQVVDRVLPGARRELLDHAYLGDIARKGMLVPEGSRTAGRAAYYMAGTGAAVAVAGLIANPFNTIGPILGVGATAWAIRRASQSLIAGVGGQRVSQFGQGIPPRGLSRLPAALQDQGGASGLAGGAIGLTKDLAQLGGAGASAALRQRQ